MVATMSFSQQLRAVPYNPNPADRGRQASVRDLECWRPDQRRRCAPPPPPSQCGVWRRRRRVYFHCRDMAARERCVAAACGTRGVGAGWETLACVAAVGVAVPVGDRHPVT